MRRHQARGRRRCGGHLQGQKAASEASCGETAHTCGGALQVLPGALRCFVRYQAIRRPPRIAVVAVPDHVPARILTDAGVCRRRLHHHDHHRYVSPAEAVGVDLEI